MHVKKGIMIYLYIFYKRLSPPPTHGYNKIYSFAYLLFAVREEQAKQAECLSIGGAAV